MLRARNDTGFTTMEVLVCLTIVAVLAALAVPSLRDFSNEQRLGSTMSQLANDLNFARTEAIKRNSRVLFCARAALPMTCASTPAWQNGWLVCYDANGDDVCDASTAADPNPMKVTSPLHAQLQLAGGTGLVRFNPIGSANAASTLTLTGTWAASSTRAAIVAINGSISSRKN